MWPGRHGLTTTRGIDVGGTGSVKKLLILILFVLGGLAVWRKVASQRADLDLWSEATAPDEY
jgi:hypothetical protein